MQISFDRSANIDFAGHIRIELDPELPSEVTQAISEWTVGPITVKGKIMASTLQSGTSATAKVLWVDAAGNPALTDGVTEWASTDDSILEVTVDPSDSLMADVHSAGPIGNAQIQATVDADMGQGIKRITAVLDVTVIAGEAFGGTIELTPA